MSACGYCGAELPVQTKGGTRRKWCNDSHRKKACYSGKCVDCGGPTAYSGQARPSERCITCAGKHSQIWTRERIIEAINAWADKTGGIPPSATDWNHAEGNSAYPFPRNVIERFGSWNAGIVAAGFEPRAVGKYGRPGEDPATLKEAARLYRSGMSGIRIAERMDVTPTTVYQWLERAGVKRRPRFTPSA